MPKLEKYLDVANIIESEDFIEPAIMNSLHLGGYGNLFSICNFNLSDIYKMLT